MCGKAPPFVYNFLKAKSNGKAPRMAGKFFPILRSCLIVAVILYIVDYLGICIHLFELDYTRYFELPIGGRNSVQENTTPVFNNYYDFAILHKAINKCSIAGSAAPHLTLLVKSALGNEHRRTVIRRTWGFERRFSDVHYRCLFLLGASDDGTTMAAINHEASEHRDIVQGDFIDAYFNNTLKTMLGIRWAKEYCAGSDYYMFVDDDYYVSIKNVLKFVAYPDLYPNTISGIWSQRQHGNGLGMLKSAQSNDERLFAGHAMQTAPLRHKFSKWYISLTEYPFDLWPPYVTAGAYLLSNTALNDIYFNGKHTIAFRFDDIFLALVALRANLTVTHCDMFHFNPPSYKGAESYHHVIASHGFDDSVYMEKVWTECREAGYA